MPNPNMTYEDYLQMFGTKEQLEEYREKQAEIRKWIDENIPVYKPENRFVINANAFEQQENVRIFNANVEEGSVEGFVKETGLFTEDKYICDCNKKYWEGL